MLLLKAFRVWLGMLLAAFLSGALRELLLVRLVGEQLDTSSVSSYCPELFSGSPMPLSKRKDHYQPARSWVLGSSGLSSVSCVSLAFFTLSCMHPGRSCWRTTISSEDDC
jgi:hypothetical protein